MQKIISTVVYSQLVTCVNAYIFTCKVKNYFQKTLVLFTNEKIKLTIHLLFELQIKFLCYSRRVILLFKNFDRIRKQRMLFFIKIYY